MLEQINAECKRAGFPLDDSAATQLGSYIGELITWNKKTNLTALKSERDVLFRLVIPSLTFSTMLPRKEGCKILDFGSGAGFPGIPIKIAFPAHDITLLDSIGKKARFLTHISANLGMSGIRCINERGEVFAKNEDERGRYDFVVAMAVSNLLTLKKYAFPFLKTGGCLVTLKGEKLSMEISDLEKRTKNHKEYEVMEIKNFSQAAHTPFSLVSIKKCST